MFIRSKIPKTKYRARVFRKPFGKFIVKMGVPVLAIENDNYLFANTQLLKEVIDRRSLFWFKILLWMGGEIKK